MPKFKSRKASDNSNDGFTETIKYHVMHQANVSSNHNKFYLLELQKHPDGRLRLFTHYGRLGITNIFEIRDNIEGDSVYDEDIIMKEFESIHKKKLRGKSVKKEDGTKERECYVDIDVIGPSVGSENIRGQSEVKKKVVVKSAIDTSSFDPKISKLITQLVDENIHNVTTQTSIKYTSNGFSSELGPVTPDHVDRARKPLDELNEMLSDLSTKDEGLDPSDKDVKGLNSKFFSLIPKPFSMKITEDDMILTGDALQAEYDILDQLATGVKMGSAMSGNTSQKMNALGSDIELLKDLEEVKRIKKYIHTSKAGNHRNEDVWNFKVKNIYKIKIPKERSCFSKTGRKIGNIKELFHGSSNSNLLSIMSSGLRQTSSNAPHVTGKMFGSLGLYFADSSTKSLRYSLGYWGSKKSKHNNAFLFLSDVALGKTFEMRSGSYRHQGTYPGYDSTSALANYGFLYNNEFIVYSTKQQTLTHLVEMC